jgi:hypothetical protein
LGLLPLPAEAASALFRIVCQRYLKTSIILNSNRGGGSCGEVLGDTTVSVSSLLCKWHPAFGFLDGLGQAPGVDDGEVV